MRCRRHGVVVCAVPWARHDSRFTRAFEDEVAWLAVNTSKTAVAELMRVAWRSVGTILERVAAEASREIDLLDGLRRIGIDRKTVLAFFDALGEERYKQIELVSADMAAWISGPIAERVPDAVRCVDPFHVVMLATEALDDVRREVWNEARRQGDLELAREQGARFAVWKNPENLTDRQAAKLATIQQTNARLYRAYPLKEQLRQIYQLPADAAERLLDRWLAWASLPTVVVRQARPHHHRPAQRDPRRDPARPLERPDRTGQHADPADRPTRVRVPQPSSADSTRDAQTRRPLPATTPVTQPTGTSGDSLFAQYPVQAFVGAQRSDLVALALALGGLALAFLGGPMRDRGQLGRACLAGFLLADAVLVRQTLFLPLLVAFAWYALHRDGRWLLAFSLAVGVTAAGAFAILQSTSHGGFLWHAVRLQGSVSFSLGQGRELTLRYLRSPATIFTLVLLVLGMLRSRGRDAQAADGEAAAEVRVLRRLLLSYLVAAVAVAAVASGKGGSNINYWLEVSVVLSILTPLYLGGTLDLRATAGSRRTRHLWSSDWLYLVVVILTFGSALVTGAARGSRRVLQWRALPYVDEVVGKIRKLTAPRRARLR